MMLRLTSSLLLVGAVAALLACGASAATPSALTALVQAASPLADAPAVSVADGSAIVAASSPAAQLSEPSPYPCSFTAPDGKYFDFSGLTTADGTRSPGANNDNYAVNVCGSIPASVAPACVGSTVCFSFIYFPSQWYAIAMHANTPAAAPPTMSLINAADSSAGVQLMFTNGNFESSSVQVAYKFMCAADAKQTTYTPKHDAQSQWSITVSGPECCPKAKPGSSGSGSGGMSGGTIFVIFVLVLGAVYVLGGCIFKRQKQGTQGMESMPNIDFWRELPGLVKDGCRFTLAKAKSLCGGGAASNEYADMK